MDGAAAGRAPQGGRGARIKCWPALAACDSAAALGSGVGDPLEVHIDQLRRHAGSTLMDPFGGRERALGRWSLPTHAPKVVHVVRAEGAEDAGAAKAADVVDAWQGGGGGGRHPPPARPGPPAPRPRPGARPPPPPRHAAPCQQRPCRQQPAGMAEAAPAAIALVELLHAAHCPRSHLAPSMAAHGTAYAGCAREPWCMGMPAPALLPTPALPRPAPPRPAKPPTQRGVAYEPQHHDGRKQEGDALRPDRLQRKQRHQYAHGYSGDSACRVEEWTCASEPRRSRRARGRAGHCVDVSQPLNFNTHHTTNPLQLHPLQATAPCEMPV